MHLRKQYVEPSIIPDKNPIKVVEEAKFLGVVFGQTLSCKSLVDYLKTNCLKAQNILKVVGHTDLGGGVGVCTLENSTLPLSIPSKI